MALKADTKVKLAAGVYGDLVTNEEVKNSNPHFGYKPSLGEVTHRDWVMELLSGNDKRIADALEKVEVTDADDVDEVTETLKAIDRDVAVAVYEKVRADILLHRPHPGPDAASHDY